MKILLKKLREYIKLPLEVGELIDLIEDVGLEVKRQEAIQSDTLINLELLANRGDHHCYEGLAREINGRIGTGVHFAETSHSLSYLEDLPVKIQTDYCMGYSVAEYGFSELGAMNLLEQDQAALEAFGYNSVSPIVDATNLVCLEIGQPLHVFDASKVSGGIVVRLSKQGEIAHPLFFDKPVELPPEILVIADDEKILAIAGVIGCESSKPERDTKRVWVESATFDPVKVRVAARSLGLSTSASIRFERGADLEGRDRGLCRLNVIAKELGWKQTGKGYSRQNVVINQRVIEFVSKSAAEFLGISMGSDEIASRLERYGFSTTLLKNGDAISVTVPSFRYWDVKVEEDLYEEIAKSIGYNKLPDFLPETSPSLVDNARKARRQVDEVLISHGFLEVFTDGFYGEQQRSLIPETATWHKTNHVTVINSEDKGYSLLKNNCVVQLAELAKANLNFKMETVRAYEWATKFLPPNNFEKKPIEVSVLCGLTICSEDQIDWMHGATEMNFYGIKGVIKQISEVGHWDLTVAHPETQAIEASQGINFLHNKRCAVIQSKDGVVGVFGEIHPEISHVLKLRGFRAYYFELNADIFRQYGPDYAYKEPKNSIPNERDVTVLAPEGITSEEIKTFLEKHAETILKVSLVDMFQKDDKSKVALTYRLFIDSKIGRSEAANLVNDLTEKLLQEFEARGVQRLPIS